LLQLLDALQRGVDRGDQEILEEGGIGENLRVDVNADDLATTVRGDVDQPGPCLPLYLLAGELLLTTFQLALKPLGLFHQLGEIDFQGDLPLRPFFRQHPHLVHRSAEDSHRVAYRRRFDRGESHLLEALGFVARFDLRL